MPTQKPMQYSKCQFVWRVLAANAYLWLQQTALDQMAAFITKKC